MGSPTPAAAAIRAATRRWSHTRVARSVAYRLGELLADPPRVLIGETPTGSKIALLSSDHQHRGIFFHGQYDPGLTRLLQRRVEPGMVLFDVGANVGYFTLIARDLGAQVHAFEPNPRVRSLLTRTLQLDGSNVVLEPLAVSDRTGTLPLYLSDGANTGKTSLERTTDSAVEVGLVTLDSYVAETGVVPDLVKIDVEGHQGAVLAGAERTMTDHMPTLIIETKDEAMIHRVESFGYQPFRIEPDGTLSPVTALSETRGWEDLYFTPTRPRAR